MEEKRTLFFKNYNCWVKDNIFKFSNLSNQRLVPEFINSIKRLHFKFKHTKIILDFSEVDKVYPYPAAAIVGYIYYFENELGIEFEYLNMPTYLKKISFSAPKIVTEKNVGRHKDCLDRIWIFNNSDEVHLLVNGILTDIRKALECEPGVIDACTWGLNEIMDNVIQHSEAKCGFIMGVIHKKTKNINISIFDYGIGIYTSLKYSDNVYNPKSAADAISLAVQEGVTRDKSVGQGNGMWGLYNIVNLNSGHMSVISGKGGLSLNRGVMKTYEQIRMLSLKQQATTVNFHLNLNKDISIKDALGGTEMVDMYIENMEDDYDRVVFKIFEAASGTGTRQSGLKIKNEVINLYKKAKKSIIIDFDNVGVISSSFADEFIGKLVVELGFYQFQKIFTLSNMNATIQTIVQRSLSQRMAESLKVS
ncbi:STAS-like domain-containing protein [Flavivirga jejuensis]|uniref:DUF4325 domain-containing protein n=1 Tax=Flavivirga jejuensis TaxID=870487 RepID=A0ABT8WPP3_9FLAO|nr:DUF4325 domain-containing protein [Flavivirga jejuensis]MDO5975153.1 DUF4325 domain-containing protein [Flavivirga jejuensis]